MTHERNPGFPLDMGWVNSVNINMPALNRRANEHKKRRSVKKTWHAAWLLRAVSVIDLTTLDGADTASNVERLCFKAATPIRQDLVQSLDIADLGITTGAICVYPERVPDVVAALARIGKYFFFFSVLSTTTSTYTRSSNSSSIVVGLFSLFSVFLFSFSLSLLEHNSCDQR